MKSLRWVLFEALLLFEAVDIAFTQNLLLSLDGGALEPGQPNYYLMADADTSSVGPEDELKRPQRFLWNKLFKKGLRDLLGDDDDNECCSNGNYNYYYDVGDGDGYNMPPPPPPPQEYGPPPPQQYGPPPQPYGGGGYGPLHPLMPLLKPWKPFDPLNLFKKPLNFGGNQGGYGPQKGPQNGPYMGNSGKQYGGGGGVHKNYGRPPMNYGNNKGGYADNKGSGGYGGSKSGYVAPAYNNKQEAAPASYDNSKGSGAADYGSDKKSDVYSDSAPVAPEVPAPYEEPSPPVPEPAPAPESYGVDEGESYNAAPEQSYQPKPSADSAPAIPGYGAATYTAGYGKQAPIIYQPIIYVSPQYQGASGYGSTTKTATYEEASADSAEITHEEVLPAIEEIPAPYEENSVPAAEPAYSEPAQPEQYEQQPQYPQQQQQQQQSSAPCCGAPGYACGMPYLAFMPYAAPLYGPCQGCGGVSASSGYSHPAPVAHNSYVGSAHHMQAPTYHAAPQQSSYAAAQLPSYAPASPSYATPSNHVAIPPYSVPSSYTAPSSSYSSPSSSNVPNSYGSPQSYAQGPATYAQPMAYSAPVSHAIDPSQALTAVSALYTVIGPAVATNAYGTQSGGSNAYSAPMQYSAAPAPPPAPAPVPAPAPAYSAPSSGCCGNPLKMTLADQPYRDCPELFSNYNNQLVKDLSY